jgi:hypothetical protein
MRRNVGFIGLCDQGAPMAQAHELFYVGTSRGVLCCF